jgi:hypothetical protein
MSSTSTVIRIRGSNPSLESGSSNLVFVLGTSATDASTDWSVVTLQNNRTVRNSSGSVVALQTSPFLVIKQTADGAIVSSSKPGIDMGGLTDEIDATLRFCTRDGGQERARIDAQGLSCSQFAADSYIGLVDSYDTFDGFRPASANALANAYVDLSNMFAAASYAGSNAPPPPTYTLVDSYVSTSVTQAPTANALRNAYSSLSNSVNTQLYLLSNGVRSMVYNAVAASIASLSSSSGGGGGGGGGGGVAFTNDVNIVSSPDQQPRLMFAAGGETVFKSTGNQNALGIDRMAFGWTVNDIDSTQMTLSGNGNLWVRGAISVGAGEMTLQSNLRIGDVTLKARGSNLGINLPSWESPQYGLHVNGLIYSEEGVYALSDAAAKSNMRPIEGALAKLRSLRGYTYDLKGRHRMGLKAQEVREAAPEAVSEDAQGCLSVAYGDLLALVVEAVRELAAAAEGSGSGSLRN